MNGEYSILTIDLALCKKNIDVALYVESLMFSYIVQFWFNQPGSFKYLSG